MNALLLVRTMGGLSTQMGGDNTGGLSTMGRLATNVGGMAATGAFAGGAWGAGIGAGLGFISFLNQQAAVAGSERAAKMLASNPDYSPLQKSLLLGMDEAKRTPEGGELRFRSLDGTQIPLDDKLDEAWEAAKFGPVAKFFGIDDMFTRGETRKEAIAREQLKQSKMQPYLAAQERTTQRHMLTFGVLGPDAVPDEIIRSDLQYDLEFAQKQKRGAQKVAKQTLEAWRTGEGAGQ